MSSTAPLDRTGLEVLTTAEAMALAEAAPVGRVAFVEHGEPVVLPVNHIVDGRRIYFRSAYGSKLDAAWRGAAVAFEVDDFDPKAHTGWSVIVRGVADPVTDDEELARLAASGLEPWADPTDRDHWVRILPNEISGRRIHRA